MFARILADSDERRRICREKELPKNIEKELKIMNKHVLYIALVGLTAFLCGCQPNPDQQVITGKNDGSFDINSAISAEGTHAPDATQHAEHQERFLSTDGSVEFFLNIDETINGADMPVLEVEPHYLAEEEIRNAAYALFGEQNYYEAEPLLQPVFSREEIQKRIQRWTQYTNGDALKELYGRELDDEKAQIQLIKSFIEQYTEMYENTPDGNPHVPAQWKFKKGTYYLIPKEEADTKDLSTDNDEITVNFRIGDIPYKFTGCTRNQSDFQVNNLTALLTGLQSPGAIDSKIFQAQLLRTSEPTEEQIAQVKATAERMLEEINLGEWIVDQCYVQTTYSEDPGISPEHVILVKALPVLNGTPALRQPQLDNLRSENAYASHYNIADAEFQFSADGKLVFFNMTGLVDVVSVVNDNVVTLSVDEVMEKAKTFFTHSDAYEYGLGDALDQIKEEIGCTVDVCDISYNLSRVKAPNNDQRYYYVPAMVFRGRVEYYLKDTGEVIYDSDESGGLKDLLMLNCVDGTVIEYKVS